ncbi:MAG: hypothetical protein QOE86_744 [Solirubrobacteraceae bacterium]|nr:hypothetical protein [Solirubrobacteraceae bacterium]
MLRSLVLALLLPVVLLVPVASASALASHEGWPPMDMLLMNKTDLNRPLDARPGADPFGGTDPRYSCDSIHGTTSSCIRRFVPHGFGFVITSFPGHSWLLGGHGNDVLNASPWGDVLWGDYKPSGQPTSQSDTLIGGDGPDFIYPSHGYNVIQGGGGSDSIHGHFGHGSVDCGPGRDVLYVKAGHRGRWNIKNCEVISTQTGKSAPQWLLRQLPW